MWCWMKQTGCLTWALSHRWASQIYTHTCHISTLLRVLIHTVCFLHQVMRIVDNVRPDRQTVMFSATFPRAMEALARRILAKPIEVQVGGRSVVCSDVEQHVVNKKKKRFYTRVLLSCEIHTISPLCFFFCSW